MEPGRYRFKFFCACVPASQKYTTRTAPEIECFLSFNVCWNPAYPSSHENAPFMNQTLKTLRMVQWALLGSIVLYAALGVLVRPVQRSIDPTISYLFTTLAVAVVGAIF